MCSVSCLLVHPLWSTREPSHGLGNPVLSASDGLEADPAMFETAVRARRVPGPTPYRRTPVSSMESRASQQLRDTTWLTDKSRDVFIHESASVKMPPQHNEINAFSEE